MTRLHVADEPCPSCPYVRTTPPGVWHESEYMKLPAYDEDAVDINPAVFLCHQRAKQKDTACRGWLTVARESVAARLAEMLGQVTGEQRYAEVCAPLYETGLEAAQAGLAGVKNPSPEAQQVIAKLTRRKARR